MCATSGIGVECTIMIIFIHTRKCVTVKPTETDLFEWVPKFDAPCTELIESKTSKFS